MNSRSQIATPEKSPGQRLRFETLLFDISARLMASPLDSVDSEIENALGRIMKFFQVDRSALLDVEEDGASCRITHLVVGEGIERVPKETNLVPLFPWSYRIMLLRGRPLVITGADFFPAEALKDRQSFEAMGIKSTLTIPLSYAGRISRLILIQTMRRHQTWPEEYIPRLRLLGDIFVNALEGREDRSKLEERLRFETLLSEISARFINLPADKIGNGIKDAQRRICELFDLGRSTLWQIPEGEPGSRLLLTYGFFPSGHPALPERMYANDFFPWVSQKVLEGETVTISKLTDLPPEGNRDLESFRSFNTKSTVVVPLSVGEGPVFGMLAFGVTSEERGWPETAQMGIKLVAQVFANALARKQMEENLKAHLHEIEGLKQRLEMENIYLQEEIRNLVEYTDIVGQSAAIKNVLGQAERVAPTDSTVLLLGETGTGKELLARAIHSLSSRNVRPLVTVNCASLPPTLIESELFGREKGAYTGALTRMTGRFELADGSTLFLDEIGELPLELQSKILRFLEEGSFERLGSSKPVQVDVRIIAATNRDIEREVEEGKFRRDLFYRLNVFPIRLPPLRERPEDIPLLVRAVVKEFQKKMGKEVESIPKRTMQAMQSYGWPGNVRELRNLVEHAMILSRGKTLDIPVPKRAFSETSAAGNLQDMERAHVTAVLEKTGWRISGPGGAAELLGLKRTTLQAKMRKLGIQRAGNAAPK